MNKHSHHKVLVIFKQILQHKDQILLAKLPQEWTEIQNSKVQQHSIVKINNDASAEILSTIYKISVRFRCC